MNSVSNEMWKKPWMKVTLMNNGSKLMEALEICGTSGLPDDVSSLELEAILGGEDCEWRIHKKEEVGDGCWRLSLIGRTEVRRTIKHGGLVTATEYRHAEMRIRVVSPASIVWKTVIAESEDDFRSQLIGLRRSGTLPRAAVARTAMA